MATNPLCVECEELDTVEHLLCECPAYNTTQTRLWVPLLTLEEVLSGPAQKIMDFLERGGRTTPSVDLPRPAAP